ncbi:MAG: PepSY domain-containing protein [Gomphosphaeria aponina SAG 52.96 = DSM 107014]|uniref:PepSY domain-containing protein n=1 Tax=Gomphosphaeria aponina SAG 52.96 = DSM 107014 TaxID=1521640 RepID=A0A941GXC0_9CHRO|nr:PepSY domain-containing protein [Gomphosphaeria aponina SAG 52.96 = DSM 107014]
MRKQKKLRQLALILHRYAGIIPGILLVIIGITGSLLIWAEQIDSFLNAQLLKVTPNSTQINIQTVIDTAQKYYPDFQVHRIIVPQKSDEVYTVMMISPEDELRDVYLNPYNGEITGERPWNESIGGFLIELHVNLFAGDIGEKIVGICGGIFWLISITGIMLWRGWFKLKNALKIRWRSPYQIINYDLHQVVGIVSVIILILLAFTGAAMIFWTPVESFVYSITNTPLLDAEIQSEIVANVEPLKIEDILQKAKTKFPEGEILKVFPAKQPEDPVVIWMELPKENEFNKTPWLSFDQYTGEVLQIDNGKENSLASRIMNGLAVIHFGKYGGIVTEIIYFLVGLAPLILLITGLVIWQQHRWHLARKGRLIQ